MIVNRDRIPLATAFVTLIWNTYCEVIETTNKMQQLDVYYQHFLNMFRASLCPSSGDQDGCYGTWCAALVLLDVVGSGCMALCCKVRALWRLLFDLLTKHCHRNIKHEYIVQQSAAMWCYITDQQRCHTAKWVHLQNKWTAVMAAVPKSWMYRTKVFTGDNKNT